MQNCGLCPVSDKFKKRWCDLVGSGGNNNRMGCAHNPGWRVTFGRHSVVCDDFNQRGKNAKKT